MLPGQMNLLKNKIKALEPLLRTFLLDTPENWSIPANFFASAHNTQPILHLQTSAFEKVFHTHPRIPLNFRINLPRNSFLQCTAQYCSELPPHSHYYSPDSYPLFQRTMLKPIFT